VRVALREQVLPQQAPLPRPPWSLAPF